MRRRRATIYERGRINEWYLDAQAGPDTAALRNEIRRAVQKLQETGREIPSPRLINLLHYGGTDQQMIEALERFYQRYPQFRPQADDGAQETKDPEQTPQ